MIKMMRTVVALTILAIAMAGTMTAAASAESPTAAAAKKAGKRVLKTCKRGQKSTRRKPCRAAKRKAARAPSGTAGAQGVQGVPGATGTTGAQGARGVKGDKGDTGEAGTTTHVFEGAAEGDKGDTGLAALSGAPFSVDSTYTLDGKSCVRSGVVIPTQYLSNGETVQKSVLLCDGRNGVDGLDGDDGDDGNPGAPGKSCVQEYGWEACKGPQGAKGDMGPPGDRGPQGIPGQPFNQDLWHTITINPEPVAPRRCAIQTFTIAADSATDNPGTTTIVQGDKTLLTDAFTTGQSQDPLLAMYTMVQRTPGSLMLRFCNMGDQQYGSIDNGPLTFSAAWARSGAQSYK